MVKEINFEILDSAAQQIKEIIKNEKSNTYLRIEILGGGCAGFSYKIDLDNNINDDDIVLSKDTPLIKDVVSNPTDLVVVSFPQAPS